MSGRFDLAAVNDTYSRRELDEMLHALNERNKTLEARLEIIKAEVWNMKNQVERIVTDVLEKMHQTDGAIVKEVDRLNNDIVKLANAML
jgi:predicted RNase H-like nuclease (RuvC/YqgF family)